MQKDKTLRFWDEYHRNESEKEWILPPNEWLLKFIVSQLMAMKKSKSSSSYRILEIGCGTSSLAYDLVEYWNRTASAEGEKHQSDHPTTLDVLATDVSALCIQQQQQQQPTNNSHLRYRTLDITLSHEELRGQFDMILDKGCLDTMLFRSKKAEQWVTKVLHNIRSWLLRRCCSTTRDGTEEAQADGVYCIITPRRKLLKSIPFLLEGFHIQRIELQNSVLEDNLGPRSRLEPRSGSFKEDSQRLFLYHCQVFDTPTTTSRSVESLPNPTDICLSCQVSFQTFYENEAASHKRSRNDKYWSRHWKGHKQHCKGKINKNGIVQIQSQNHS
jgi:SAM-dependent methyltransferase